MPSGARLEFFFYFSVDEIVVIHCQINCKENKIPGLFQDIMIFSKIPGFFQVFQRGKKFQDNSRFSRSVGTLRNETPDTRPILDNRVYTSVHQFGECVITDFLIAFEFA